MKRKELKLLTRNQIKGKVGLLFVCMLIMSTVASMAVFANLFFPQLMYVAILPPFILGMIMINLKVADGKEFSVADIFEGFKVNFVKSIKLELWYGLFVWLWTLLFLIPGIIKSYSYSMSFFILAENPEITAKEAITRSKELMKGHKWEYFVLHLSFIGWYLLSMITFGLAMIYVSSYVSVACANFYRTLVSKKEETVVEIVESAVI